MSSAGLQFVCAMCEAVWVGGPWSAHLRDVLRHDQTSGAFFARALPVCLFGSGGDAVPRMAIIYVESENLQPNLKWPTDGSNWTRHKCSMLSPSIVLFQFLPYTKFLFRKFQNGLLQNCLILFINFLCSGNSENRVLSYKHRLYFHVFCGWICGFRKIQALVYTVWASWIYIPYRWRHDKVEIDPLLLGFTEHRFYSYYLWWKYMAINPVFCICNILRLELTFEAS